MYRVFARNASWRREGESFRSVPGTRPGEGEGEREREGQRDKDRKTRTDRQGQIPNNINSEQISEGEG